MRRRTFVPVACALCAITVSLGLWRAIQWRATLRSELRFYSTSTIGSISIPKIDAGASYFSISADAGRILKSHDQAEVLAYLAMLRQNATPFGKSLLRGWADVVTSGARGMPTVHQFTQGKESRQLATYTYDIPWGASRTPPPSLTARPGR